MTLGRPKKAKKWKALNLITTKQAKYTASTENTLPSVRQKRAQGSNICHISQYY
jgi:hypothetical protein